MSFRTRDAFQPAWPRLKLNVARKGSASRSPRRVASVACAVGVGEALTAVLRLPNLSMIFLTAVLFCSVRFGTRAAVIASLASFVAYNFFFIEPIYTFTVAQPQELFALLIFLAVAVLTGSLAGRIRDQRESRAQERRSHPVALRLLAQTLGRLERRRRPLGGGGASARDFRRPHCLVGCGSRRPAAPRRMAARRAARRRPR